MIKRKKRPNLNKTATEKLNEALGISSIDEMLDSLSLDTPNEIQSLNDNISSAIVESSSNIDNQIKEYNDGKDISLPVMESNLAEISELIGVSKKIIAKVYENIITNEFVDSELVLAASQLIQTTHTSVSIYIDLYKERKRFYNQVAMKMLDHKNKLELLQRKHEYKMLEMEKGNKTEEDVENRVNFSQANIMKALQEMNL